VTFQDGYTTAHALPKQCPAASPDPAGDDFETLLEASTLASPTVERIRRLTPPDVCEYVQAQLDVRPLADVLTLRVLRRHRGDRPSVTVFHSGHVEFGKVVGPAVLANWSRSLQLAILTVPLLVLALAGLVLFYLQLRPERWLGAAACAASTAAAGGAGLRWRRRRLSRWRGQASPRWSPR
jgi:hypothetical protein